MQIFFLFRFPLFFDIFDIFFSKMLLFLFCSAVENTSDDHHHGFFFSSQLSMLPKTILVIFFSFISISMGESFCFFPVCFQVLILLLFFGWKIIFLFYSSQTHFMYKAKLWWNWFSFSNVSKPNVIYIHGFFVCVNVLCSLHNNGASIFFSTFMKKNSIMIYLFFGFCKMYCIILKLFIISFEYLHH